MRKCYPAVIGGIGTEQLDIAFPDFPGCVTIAGSIEESHRRAEEVLSFHVASMVEDGDELPVGGDEEALLRLVQEFEQESYRTLIASVAVDIPEVRLARLDIAIPEYVIQAIDRWTQEHGESQSSLLASAAMDYMTRHR